ncbi:hypothetical protein EI94DRAFT_1702877 [Lactarius quietus]|nr:hypothetical protein EI94DRAFT_1702877 [Lactarius quietus]
MHYGSLVDIDDAHPAVHPTISNLRLRLPVVSAMHRPPNRRPRAASPIASITISRLAHSSLMTGSSDQRFCPQMWQVHRPISTYISVVVRRYLKADRWSAASSWGIGSALTTTRLSTVWYGTKACGDYVLDSLLNALPSAIQEARDRMGRGTGRVSVKAIRGKGKASSLVPWLLRVPVGVTGRRGRKPGRRARENSTPTSTTYFASYSGSLAHIPYWANNKATILQFYSP